MVPQRAFQVCAPGSGEGRYPSATSATRPHRCALNGSERRRMRLGTGLGPAVKSLARRASLPVNLDLRVAGRLPEPVEVAAYYMISEALANAVKHASASAAEVEVRIDNETLCVHVRDNGTGGADPARGSGIVGLRDRVEALGGRLMLASPRGQGPRCSPSSLSVHRGVTAPKVQPSLPRRHRQPRITQRWTATRTLASPRAGAWSDSATPGRNRPRRCAGPMPRST